jgi:hypothetical protein
VEKSRGRRAFDRVGRYAFGPIDSVAKFAWKVRNRLIGDLAESGGRYLYKTHLLWLLDLSWLEQYEEHLLSHGVDKLDPDLWDRRFALAELCKLAAPLEGDTAEAGAFQGHGSVIIAKTLEDTYRENEHHYAFDSFEGLRAPTEDDRRQGGWKPWREGQFGEVREEQTRSVLAPFPFTRIVKGWIPDCLSDVPEDARFRLVHIDVDLFEATDDSVRFFYPRLVPDGVMIFDDYGFLSCPGAKKAVDEYFADKPEPVVNLPSGQAFIIKK